MENDALPQTTATHSISNLIAWLSVCLLAAAWGSSLGPEWALPWMQWGAFGLVAAVGLNFGDRLRQAKRKRAEQDAAIDRLERRLDTVIDEEGTSDSCHAGACAAERDSAVAASRG